MAVRQASGPVAKSKTKAAARPNPNREQFLSKQWFGVQFMAAHCLTALEDVKRGQSPPTRTTTSKNVPKQQNCRRNLHFSPLGTGAGLSSKTFSHCVTCWQ
jgi:hypothetical protein